MASHSELAVVNCTGNTPVSTKPRKTRKRSTTRAKAVKRTPSQGGKKRTRETQPSGTDVVPVMKLRAIDIVGDGDEKPSPEKGAPEETAGKSGDVPQVIHMPPPLTAGMPDDDVRGKDPTFVPAPDDHATDMVTDPELLELLEQLSVTIDTAHSVLDAAATIPDTTGEPEDQEPGTPDAHEVGSDHPPVPDPETRVEAEPDPEDDEPPPLAASDAEQAAIRSVARKAGAGFGLLANTALTGLVFAAGVAWLLHTNPWLLERESLNTPSPNAITASVSPGKDQSALPARERPVQQVASVSSATLAAFTPPDEEPVPMETIAPEQTAAGHAPDQPLRGLAGKPIGLNIALPVASQGIETSVMVQGVPAEARLSAGKDLGSGNWLLNETQMEGLSLKTQHDFKPGTHELEVIMVRSDGSLPVSRKLAVTVGTAGAVAPASQTTGESNDPRAASATGKTTYAKTGIAVDLTPIAAAAAPMAGEPAGSDTSLSAQEVHTLLVRGDTLLREGDVAGARLLLQYAAERGSKQAMVRLAKSFDPEHLAQLGVRGVQPDAARATQWYERAANSATPR